MGQNQAAQTARIAGGGVGFTAADSAGNVRTTPANADYVTVPVSTTKALGSAGAAGDVLASLLIIPLTTSPGEVQIKDGTTAIEVFAGGATSVADLKPFTIMLGLTSLTGGWSVVTGANVTAVAAGNFA